MKTYHITMSDGEAYDFRGSDAVEAMSKALFKHRGLTVIKCYAGNTDPGAPQAGRVEYEVPRHRPIPHTEPES